MIMDIRILFAFTLLAVATALNAFNLKFPVHFWQTSHPGQLLNALDSMTNDDLRKRASIESIAINTTPSPTSTSSSPIPNGKSKPDDDIKLQTTPHKRMITSEDNSAASGSAETDEYERKYEQFVRNYFDDAAERYLSNENDESNESAEASNLSSDISSEGFTNAPLDAVPFESSAKSTKKNGKKCRKVRRKRETCLICKNFRNGDHSETCSYERASEPESYAYETQRKYRKTRDRENSSSDADEHDEEDEKIQNRTSEETIAESQVKKEIVKPEKLLNATAASSSCLKRSINGKSCYYCKDAVGTQAIKCFDLIPQQKVGDRKNVPLKNNVNTHQKRRIYKRTLSYVYSKGLDSNESQTSPEDLNSKSTVSLK